MDPPAHALVLSADAKTQTQALQRTQTCLPLLRGQVTAQTLGRHRQQEFLAFLDHLAPDPSVPRCPRNPMGNPLLETGPDIIGRWAKTRQRGQHVG